MDNDLISRSALLNDMSYKAPEAIFTTDEICYLKRGEIYVLREIGGTNEDEHGN